MFLLYDFVFFLYALIYLPYLLLTNRWYPGFGMRFGFFSPLLLKQVKTKTNIWVHAVSVGEVTAVDGFIDQLRKKHPESQVVLTVTTKTGYLLARERLENRALVVPSPIDFGFTVRRFVSLIRPKVYVAVETEIWPNLYRELYVAQVPLLVINGRISDASLGRYKAVAFLLKGVLNQVSLWCMQSQRDAQRIMDLGADSARVVVTGNIKFDDLSQSMDPSIENLVAGQDDLWWVAGSTHPGEEEIVLDIYSKIIKHDPKWRLVIAPRHIDRVPHVIELINRHGMKAVKLSQGHTDRAVIVVDTIGQLRFLYSLASLVFVGKSLCVGGGHNIIEPALYAKAIIIGPKFENFRDIVACFKEKNAIVQVDDVHSFENAVISLCADPSKRRSLGEAAKELIAVNQGATRRNLERLEGFLK